MAETDPLCIICAERHPHIVDENIAADPGCNWNTFPGFGWRDALHTQGWILHEDNQTGEALWLRQLGNTMWEVKDTDMKWTPEEYRWLFTKVPGIYEV